MYDAVDWQIDQFVKALRHPDAVTLQMNVDRLMRNSWGIGEDANVIGMTEIEFTRSI